MGDAAEPPPGDEIPVDEIPAPEPVTVTLVDVQPDVWWAWDADGSVWLLPAYRLIDTDGGWHVVPAVTDEFMIQVEPRSSTGRCRPSADAGRTGTRAGPDASARRDSA